MKKSGVVGLLLLLTCFVVCACQKQEIHYDAFVCNVIDSLSEGVSIQPELENWSMSRHKDEDAEDQLSVYAFDMNITGDYDESTKKAGNPNKTAHYRRTNGGEFSVDSETGRLVGYTWRNAESTSSIVLTHEQLIEVARTMLNTIVDSSDYHANVEWLEDWNMYHIQFVKYIDGVETTDRADFYLLPDGSPSSYSAGTLGLIPSDLSIKINYNAAEEAVNRKVETLYQNINKENKYDDVQLSVQKKTITILENGSYAIIYSVDVYFVTYYEETQATEHGNSIGYYQESHMDIVVPVS